MCTHMYKCDFFTKLPNAVCVQNFPSIFHHIFVEHKNKRRSVFGLSQIYKISDGFGVFWDISNHVGHCDHC
jgi:hypothetical protein